MTDIKNCPFCGAEARLHSNYSPEADLYYIYVQCTKCYARGMTTRRGKPAAIGVNEAVAHDALAAWNRREGQNETQI